MFQPSEEVKEAESPYDMLKKKSSVSGPRNHMIRSKVDKADTADIKKS